ncbi:MAG: YpdA family putative bacillithiol disulfide reductase [Bacteroidota bacterium]
MSFFNKANLQKMYDIIIIGGGPIGLACALAAKQAGLTYLILEKGALVNSLYQYPSNMTFFSTSERLEIGEIPFVSNNSRPTRSEALEYYRRVAQSRQLNINLFETVETVGARLDRNVYFVKTSKSTYSTKKIIVATGFYDIPVLMNVEGEDLPKVYHYYKEPHFYYGQKVVVVGASNSAADAALEIFRKGGDVTMIIRGQEVSHRVKYWVRPDLLNRIQEKSIQVFYQSTIHSIQPNTVKINTLEGIQTIENDYVLALTGYQPDFAFLEKMGIDLSQDGTFHPSYDVETQESNLKGIYLAGVVCGGMDTHKWFIENSRIHAEQILKSINSTLKKGLQR